MSERERKMLAIKTLEMSNAWCNEQGQRKSDEWRENLVSEAKDATR